MAPSCLCQSNVANVAISFGSGPPDNVRYVDSPVEIQVCLTPDATAWLNVQLTEYACSVTSDPYYQAECGCLFASGDTPAEAVKELVRLWNEGPECDTQLVEANPEAVFSGKA